jgi:Protein of unknown function (DUF1559)
MACHCRPTSTGVDANKLAGGSAFDYHRHQPFLDPPIRGTSMISRSKWIMSTVFAMLLMAAPARAEPLPPELNLVPRDAGLFVSIRVSDLWNDAGLKPLRDFLVEEGSLLRDFEKETGFRPDDVERVSLICANFHPRHIVPEPLIVVTFKKPYDLAKLLDTWGGMTEADYRRFMQNQPIPKGGIAFPKVAPFGPPPRLIEEKPADAPAPPRVKEPPKAPFADEEEPEFAANNQKEDPDGRPVKKGPRDLKAPYYFLAREGGFGFNGFLVPINERTIVIGRASQFDGDPSLHELLAALLKRSAKGPLTPAIEAAAGKHAVVLGVNLPAISETLPEKGWVHALPIDTLMKCRSLTGTLDFGPEIRLAFHVEGPDETTAKRMLDVMRSIHILGMESLPGLKKLGDGEFGSTLHVLFTLVEPIFRAAKFEQKGNIASVVMASRVDEQFAKTIKETLETLKEVATRTRSQNNLKQLAIAVHSYHDAMGRFPFQDPNVRNPKLSWRVTILPYIEEGALYNQFKLNEPWDSEHNKKLIPKMPKLYAPLGLGVNAPPGHTFYRTFTGRETISAAQTFVGVTDGTSNTIMIVEAGESTPWTKPEDFPYDPNKPLPKLGGHFKGKMHVAMGDGSVRTIDLTKVPEHVLRALITAQGGEVVGDY